jgi:hypothetical protein
MIQINNSDLTRELREGAKIQVATDGIPSELGKTVVPVMESNPKLLRTDRVLASLAVSATNASSSTLIAADPNRDIFITAAQIHIVKDATCDVASAVKSISCNINGVTVNLLLYSILSLTAQDIRLIITFKNPIKIDRNSAVTTNAFSFAAGNALRAIAIFGHSVENINA